MFKRRKKLNQLNIDLNNVPKHIAFIMDGNGRWAKAKGLPRTAGHYEGSKRVRDLALESKRLGIKAITFYAFSTENWKRPEEEVNYIMKLPKEFFGAYFKDLMDNDIRVNFIGEIDRIPEETRLLLLETVEKTKDNQSVVLTLALNYGSQREMVLATQKIASQVVEGSLLVEDINEQTITNNLMTKDLPAVDLLIRTSGEKRLSNYLLYQLAYSEMYFTDIAWPDFDGKQLENAIIAYQNRDRRYGGIK